MYELVLQVKTAFSYQSIKCSWLCGVVGFCIVSCDTKPASQAADKVCTVESSCNTAPASETRPNESHSADPVSNAENTTNTNTTKPENTADDAVNTNADGLQPVPDTGIAAQDHNRNQANAETNARDLNIAPPKRDIDKIAVVSQNTPGAIKIEFTTKNARLDIDYQTI